MQYNQRPIVTAAKSEGALITAITLYKNMKNILLTLAAISGTAWSTFAQTSSTLPKDSLSVTPASRAHFSFGLEGGRTVPGQAKAILGGSFKYELPFASHTLFTASVGYSFLSFREETKKAPEFLWHQPERGELFTCKGRCQALPEQPLFCRGAGWRSHTT